MISYSVATGAFSGSVGIQQQCSSEPNVIYSDVAVCTCVSGGSEEQALGHVVEMQQQCSSEQNVISNDASSAAVVGDVGTASACEKVGSSSGLGDVGSASACEKMGSSSAAGALGHGAEMQQGSSEPNVISNSAAIGAANRGSRLRVMLQRCNREARSQMLSATVQPLAHFLVMVSRCSS